MTHNTITAALNAVMSEVSYVQKQDSQQLGYAVLTEQEVIAKARPAFVKHGIVCYPIKSELLEKGQYATKSGSMMNYLIGRRTFRFQLVGATELIEGVTYIDAEAVCDAADAGDKAALKVCTVARKYIIRETLCLETGHDPDLVIAQRGAPNAERFRRAVSRIKSCKSTDDTAQWLEKILNSKASEWTEEQITSLHTVRSQHDDWLAANAAKNAEKQAKQTF